LHARWPWKAVLLVAALALAALVQPSGAALADLGVGISHGEIVIDEKLAQGSRQRLPSVTVSNTGPESARYEVVISFVQDQRELRPDPDWFRFEPQAFDLDPGESQAVSIRLNVDDGAEPGDYFALIEAHPIQSEAGVTVGVAAATKLFFEVEPSNFFELWRLRIAQFFDDNSPYSVVLPPVLAGILLLYLLSRRFRLRVERKR
jgi:hypothetical protein